MKNIADELRQREAETEKLKQTLRNTPPSDPAYVRTCVGSCRGVSCLVPRPHFYAWLMPFGSRGPSEFVSDTSPKFIDREGLGRYSTGTRQECIYKRYSFWMKTIYTTCANQRTYKLCIACV